MNFQQLRIIRETLRRNFNLTEVANALYTSQSGVSKHIKDLEDELGVELFVRRGKRLLGLTEPGKELAQIVDRILLDTENIKKLGEQFANRDRGTLNIATTHTQARYALLPVVAKFRAEFPNVHLVLHQGSPSEIARMLIEGSADIGVATEALQDVSELVSFPYYTWHHGVVVPAGHQLQSVTPLTLKALSEWPIITYSEGFTGRSKIDKAFAGGRYRARHRSVGPRRRRHQGLRGARPRRRHCRVHGCRCEARSSVETYRAQHLFDPNISRIALRRATYVRRFAYRFVELARQI